MIAAIRALLSRRAEPLPARWRNSILAVAAVGVAIVSVWAWRSSGLSVDDLEWVPIAALFAVAAPLSLGLKAAEFDVAARIASQRPSVRRSFDVAVVSSAANLLPLPGSLIVTVQSLSTSGSTYGGALAASAVPGLAWVGLTGIAGGIGIAVAGPPLLGVAVMGAGIIAGAIAARLFVATAPVEGRVTLAARIVGVEVGWLAVSALRLGLAVVALGETVDLPQALALSVAGALTVAIGFFPSGLGVREALLAGLSPLIGLELDIGVLIGTVDRIVWLVFLAVVAGAFSLRRNR
jgi:hypothetical protein